MENRREIKHPIIKSYVQEFASTNGLDAADEHILFEMYINNLLLDVYCNDSLSSFHDMETGSAFGIDGIAIIVNEKLVSSEEDVDFIIEKTKKIDVEFIFTQMKTSDKFTRTEISDFYTAIVRFFNFDKCSIPEIRGAWEIMRYIYGYAAKFKSTPRLKLFFTTLSGSGIDMEDIHLKEEIRLGIVNLKKLSLFQEIADNYLCISDIMNLNSKVNSGHKQTVTLDKQLVPYPKLSQFSIDTAYFGLISLKNIIELVSHEIDNEMIIKKGIFDDNFRDYLGSELKNEVNSSMKEQLNGSAAQIFGLLNNGVSIIADEALLNSTELSLDNYQIVNGCQTSNVIFEMKEKFSDAQLDEIYIPFRVVATTDIDAKIQIARANNNQTELKKEQIQASSQVHKALEEYYNAKLKDSPIKIYYERRTEQYRNEEIPKVSIINIPFQRKATSAMFLELPEKVSGQYGKVERETEGKLFTDLEFLNCYYVSGLAWYRVEAFIRNNDEGKKYRRVRWHILLILKYLIFDVNKVSDKINKNANNESHKLEEILSDDVKSLNFIENSLQIIKDYMQNIDSSKSFDEHYEDRKLFERKETTTNIIKYILKLRG